jgi:hypothetical protein
MRLRYAPVEEVVIVIADLYLTSAKEAASIRGVELPGLGRIARYGSGEPIGRGWRPWLAEWAGYASLATEAPASVASAASQLQPPEGVSPMVWLATPVHFVAGLSSVHLDARGLLQVELDVRQAMAEEFNALFAESGYRLEPLHSAGFLLLSPTVATPPTVDPARVLGASISEALPAAAEAPALRRLSAEIEMWLHEHPVNQRRVKRGRLPITALWFWGGGVARPGLGFEPQLTGAQEQDTVPASTVRGAAALMARARATPGAAFGGDPYLHGLWRCAGGSARATPHAFDEVLGYCGRRAVFVVELSQAFDEHRDWTLREALSDLDQRWIVRALEAMHRGDIARVTIVANDHRLSLGPRDRLKLWRMPRPALAALQ